MKSRPAADLVKNTFSEFSDDRVMRHSAALAYYSVFSIAPLLVLIVGLAGLIFGEENVRRQVAQQLQGLVGESSTKLISSMMTAREGRGSLMATIVGGVALILGASGVFGQLQDSLNTIWGVTPKPGQGIAGFIRQRFLSMAMVLGIGFLLLISMALSAAVSALSGWIERTLSLPPWVSHGAELILSFGVTTLLFGLIFKVLPDVKIRWRDVIVGAMSTALLFTIGKFLLGLYLGRAATASAYGAGSAFIMVILYIYYASVILFLGAEFTQVYARRHGEAIEPSPHAVKITDEERARQGMPTREQVKRAVERQRGGARGRKAPVLAGGGLQAEPTGGSKAFEGEYMQYSKESGIPAGLPPGEVVAKRVWSFVAMAVGAGLAAGALMRFPKARKALGLYLTLRRPWR